MIRPHGAFRSTFVLLLPCIAIANLHAQATPLREVIDAQMQKAWKQKKSAPAKPAADGEFLRRVYLDLAGSVPTYEETVAFLTSKDPATQRTLLAHPYPREVYSMT